MTRRWLRGAPRRGLAHSAVVVLGLLAIVGSGGGLGFPELNFDPAPIPPLPTLPTVAISPSRATVQAGAIVEFTATVSNATLPVSFQWRRGSVDIAGATGPTYTLGGATLADDAAVFQVFVAAANGTATSSTSLFVSSLPPVVFADTEFPVADWEVTGAAQPQQNGPTFTADQASEGGNPGAHRRVVYQMTPAPSSLRLVHLQRSSTYSPPSQGAVYTVTFELDCSRTAVADGLGSVSPRATPAFQQSGRTYTPISWNSVCGAWQHTTSRSLIASDFAISDGTACGASENCPDFSAIAAPLRFGVFTRLSLDGTSPGGSVTQGLDNWKVNVWRK